jgi:hypothetical protein
LVKSILDISPNGTDGFTPAAKAMLTVRATAEMALLVGAALAVLIIAAIVL